jgi:HK97 gp10 family phage protein
MIAIKVEVSGDVAKKLHTFSSNMTKYLDRALLSAAILLEAEIKKKISRGGRGGATYRVGKRNAQRSAPGEPPKTDSGRLVGSIRHEHSFLSASVGSEVNYAGYLEFGTSKMAARPYLVPTLEENTDTIEKMVEDAMREAMGS